jgi:hypothetical protein
MRKGHGVMSMNLSNPTWRKSSYSNGVGGNCVEVGDLPGAKTALRDSKNPDGGVLVFDSRAWTTLVAKVKSGQL